MLIKWIITVLIEFKCAWCLLAETFIWVCNHVNDWACDDVNNWACNNVNDWIHNDVDDWAYDDVNDLMKKISIISKDAAESIYVSLLISFTLLLMMKNSFFSS